jgi:hypothetical protein
VPPRSRRLATVVAGIAVMAGGSLTQHIDICWIYRKDPFLTER